MHHCSWCFSGVCEIVGTEPVEEPLMAMTDLSNGFDGYVIRS